MACRSSSACSRAARPRRPASRTATRSSPVDGKQTKGHTIDEIVGWVRGEAGSTVKVTVKPGATGTEREVSMVRADVAVVPVYLGARPGHEDGAHPPRPVLGRRCGCDQGGTRRDIKAAGADRLVLDLRGNPGGYVNEADAVASQFLKSGVVFIERAADGHETKHEVAPGGLATDLPLVVLVDGGTASSSEIVSGAIQDAGRAQIVGVKTYGTGTVLGEFPLSDGSALRVGHGRMADARRAARSGTRASPRTSSSSARATSRRSTPTRSAR